MATAGRKELLTEELARKIAKMIERMPDIPISVTWENVIAQCRRKFEHGFNRQMLSQKEWNGRKIIAEAFSEAKSVQSRMHHESAPKYKSAPRALLQKRIGDLEARNMALQEELEKVRAQQIEELDVFLNTPRDLRTLIEEAVRREMATGRPVPVDELRQKRDAKKVTEDDRH